MVDSSIEKCFYELQCSNEVGFGPHSAAPFTEKIETDKIDCFVQPHENSLG